MADTEAMLIQQTGKSSSPGGLVTITLSGICLVRIGALSGAPGASAAEAFPVPHPATDAGVASTPALQDAVLPYADPALQGLRSELGHLRSLRSGEAVTTWALHRLDLTGPGLLRIYVMPAAPRTPMLLGRLDKGARFRPEEA